MDSVLPDPVAQFTQWFERACATSIDKPNAMVLSTVHPDGQPAARVVLLSSHDEYGFVFHTNYQSDKGVDLEANDRACLLFWWDELGYQIRIEGRVAKTDPADSDAYFAQRPRGSQVGAWASEQSRAIAGREVLDERVGHYAARFDGAEVPRPPHWGGYRLSPERFEFWENRDDRLHDRFVYVHDGADWRSERLAP